MSQVKRKVDAKGRIVLPQGFAGQMVCLTPVSDTEVRISIARPLRGRPARGELLSRVTEDNRHTLVDFGPPVGEEQL